jgi:transposase InsO family protein
MVKYITGWVKAEFVASKAWPHILLMLTKVQNRFGLSHELVNNNALEFNSKIAKEWHKQHNTRVLPTTPARPRGNGKVEQLNSVLKSIIIRVHLTHPDIPLADLLQSAVNIHNWTPKPSGYSLFFLLYGITPPDRTSPEAYIRESTIKKDMAHKREMARHHEASESRNRAKRLKASQNQVRAYLKKKKTFFQNLCS